MSELQLLEQSVLKQAEENGQRQREKAEKRLAHQAKTEQARLEKEAQERLDQQKKQLRDRYGQESQQIKNRERLLSLETKQHILSELFQSAHYQMNQWSRDEQLRFIYQVLNQFKEQTAKITLGEKTRVTLQDKDLHDLDHNFPKLTIDTETIRGEGGFVLNQGQIDYNYLYGPLVAATKTHYSPQLAQTIFKEG